MLAAARVHNCAVLCLAAFWALRNRLAHTSTSFLFLLLRYDVTVVGRNGVVSPASNLLSFVTPAANAPLNSGAARSATVVVVSIAPPSAAPVNGGTW